jgi:signal transduction histidine kinase
MTLRGRPRRHSLSGKLIMLFVLVAAAVVVAVGSAVGWAFRSHFEDNIRPHLMQYLSYIEADIGSPPSQDKAMALSQRLAVQIDYADATGKWTTGDTPVDVAALHSDRQFVHQDSEYAFAHHDDREYLISRHPGYTLAFSMPRRERSHWLQVIPVLVTLLALVLLYHATQRLFAPIRTLQSGIQRIGSGDLRHRITVARRDELGELSTSINAMADDIERMLEAKRQLLLAISHELRSPLTRAKVATAMLDDPAQRRDIERDLDEMETLIEELLETERLSARHHVLQKSPTVVQTLIEELLAQFFAGHTLEVIMPSDAITLAIDAARIKLLIRNLLANALQYTAADCAPPTLRVERQAATIRITVRDHGPGIAPEHLPHLAEPFYRTDAARQRQTGGYGLGLYLCKVIAEAHGGQLHIVSRSGEGTTVSVTLPC